MRHEQIGAHADCFAHTWVQLLGRRVGEAQFQLSVPLNLHGLVGRVYATFQIVCVGKRAVLET